MAPPRKSSAARRLADAVAAERSHRVDLPLRYWNQVAHYVTPASDAAKVRSATHEGTRPFQRLLADLGLRAADVAVRLGLETSGVELALSAPERAPVVVLDGEDSVADAATRQASILAITGGAIREGDWGAPPGQGVMRAYRMERLIDHQAQGRVATFLRSIADPARPEAYALDVVVYPKAEMPEEIDLLLELLDEAEASMDLPRGRIRVALIAESATALARLDVLATRALSRLCAIVVGTVDYAADVGALIEPDRLPSVDWVRATVVNTAAAHGVPAIDGMTAAYPLGQRGPATDDDRGVFLDRIASVYQAARDAFDIGMSGKWVGHPAQLFAVLLAWRTAMAPTLVESQIEVLQQYRTAVDRGNGVIAIGGTMIDAASERLARARLRRAAATGLLNDARARAIGALAPDEAGPRAEHFRLAMSSDALPTADARS